MVSTRRRFVRAPRPPLRWALVVAVAALPVTGDSLASAASPPPAYAPATGSPFADGPTTAGHSFAQSLAFSPNGKLLVVGNAGGGHGNSDSLSAFTVGADGELSPVATDEAQNGPDNVNGPAVVFNATGSLLASTGSGNLTVYQADSNGTLTPGAPVTGVNPGGVAFDPIAPLVAISEYYNSEVAVYPVSSSGALGSSPTTQSTGTNSYPTSVAFNDDGNYLAVANSASSQVSIFTVGSGGALGTISGSPIAVPGAPEGVAFSSTGLLAAALQPTSGNGSVAVLALHNGSWGQVAGSPFQAGGRPATVAFSPDGELLAVTNSSDNTVSVFSVSAAGALAPVAGSPLNAGTGPEGVAFGPDDALMAVADESSDEVSVFGAVPPAPVITTPASGGTYTTGATVTTAFSCPVPAAGPAVTGCSDSAGAPAPSGQLPTSAPGAHTYTVTATNGDSQTSSTSVSYTVVGPPVAEISSPTGGGTYDLGQSVPTSFSCQEGAAAPGLSSCLDSNGAGEGGGHLNTSTAGAHTYSVTAKSMDGFSTTVSIRYVVVVPPPSASLARLVDAGPTATVTVSCAGDPGTTCTGRLTATTKRGTVATATFSVAGGASKPVRLTLDAAARRQLGRSYRLSTTLELTGSGTAKRTLVFSYPFVTRPPGSGWATWNWTNEPCRPCTTRVYTGSFFGIPRLPTTATVKLSCNGTGCPNGRTYKPGRSSLKLDSVFSRRLLSVGAEVTLQITAPNDVGRVITWKMLAGAAPKLTVRCLPPGARHPIGCPR